LFISRAAWEGLAVLGAAEEDGGWLPAIEIGNRIASSFVRNDAEILIARRLAERRPTADASRAARGEQQYRATALGRGARLLDGKTSETRVQVRVPGLVLRQPVPIRRGNGPVSGG